jgi:hypothetical protein
METNGLVNAAMVVVTGAEIMGSHPAANAFVLQIPIEATSQCFIRVGVGDEKRVILKSSGSQDGRKILNGSVRKADTTQKVGTGVLIGRECYRVDIDC